MPDFAFREGLLNRFFESGLHPRLLLHLRGATVAEEWASLEKLVFTSPAELDPDDVFRGNWRRWWGRPQPTP
jgi:hypothetical protein